MCAASNLAFNLTFYTVALGGGGGGGGWRMWPLSEIGLVCTEKLKFL